MLYNVEIKEYISLNLIKILNLLKLIKIRSPHLPFFYFCLAAFSHVATKQNRIE